MRATPIIDGGWGCLLLLLFFFCCCCCPCFKFLDSNGGIVNILPTAEHCRGVVGHLVDGCWTVVGQSLVGRWSIIELGESRIWYCLDQSLAAAI